LNNEGKGLSYYTTLFANKVEAGDGPREAAVAAAEAYLDGKPRQRGKRKLTRADRDREFWTSNFLPGLPAEAWHSESLVLALSRYMGQERVENAALLDQTSAIAPEAVRRAVRYSGLVLKQHSPRRTELDRLAGLLPDEFHELALVLDIFDKAYRSRLAAVEMFKQPFAKLSPLELLAYASLYAFEHLAPRDYLSAEQPAGPDARSEVAWGAINDLLIWKLGSADHGALHLTDNTIGASLAEHLSPFLFPSPGERRPREDLYQAFEQLLSAQIELNSFISRSADAFSYDDGITFVRRSDRLEIVELDPAARAKWKHDGEKLTRLHHYWLYRAIDAFAASELASAVIGRPENQDANRYAYIKAIAAQLQLTEVYGLDQSVTAPSGLRVDIFQAMLSLQLMTAFFNQDFMLPFLRHLGETGNSRLALGLLAFGGMMQPASPNRFHNRFPVTWSDRRSKIANIKGWTVSKEFPRGSVKAAEAILDFWTSDWSELAARLRNGEPGLHPELFERPILKMGRYLFQLPWVVAMQNNASAAINNLRRIGGRRAEARAETQRIEQRLAERFEARGFRVQLNYLPERTPDSDPGEVDLICARDGQILILEIKSTFLRRSQKDAWLHGATTLRRAGQQLRSKVLALRRSLVTDVDLASALGFEADGAQTPILGWIVDTSIEHDHVRFSGFLKVSLEEVLIALRDDSHLLNDPDGLLSGAWMESHEDESSAMDEQPTLYPDGFSFARFVDVIEGESVWSTDQDPEK
jgi:hypothetical protein